MPHELPKAYEPGAIETRWADYWVKEKLFSVATPAVGEIASHFELLDSTGTRRSLSELTSQGPLVLLFYRGHW